MSLLDILHNLIRLKKSLFFRCFLSYEVSRLYSSRPTSYDPKLQVVSKNQRKNPRFFQAKQVMQDVYYSCSANF